MKETSEEICPSQPSWGKCQQKSKMGVSVTYYYYDFKEMTNLDEVHDCHGDDDDGCAGEEVTNLDEVHDDHGDDDYGCAEE